MKHTLLREINRDMASRHRPALAVVHDPARIRGGNWNMQGFRRSALVFDAAECGMSIAEFLADTQERADIVD